MISAEGRYMIKQLGRDGVSVSELARQTGHDRKTVRRVLDEPVVPAPAARQGMRYRLGPYVAYLEQRISAGVLNASKLYDEIKQQGYAGSRSQLRAFVRPYREPRQSRATMRFETAPGEQLQVDWGHFGLINHRGHQRRLYAFVATLGWSRALYVEFTVSTDTGWWLRCHCHAFAYFGGIPRVVLHDNLKSAVLQRDMDGHVHWNPRYLDFADYYGVTLRACQPYRARTKGKVESGVKYVRGNFWLGLRFTDLQDLNHQAWAWLEQIANRRIHGTTGEVPAERLPHEHLQPLWDKPPYDTSVISYRHSTSDCLISYDGSFYSVPAGFHQQQLLVKETENQELLIYDGQGAEIARHQLSLGYNQRIIDPAHFQGLASITPRPKRAPAVQLPAPELTAPLQVDAPLVETRSLHIYQAVAEERVR